jgi:glutamate synthase domain-containing protein 2
MAGFNPICAVPVAAYWLRGYWDMMSEDSILANFPVLGWFRYICLNIRPEIQQYFIEDNNVGKPFSHEQRSIVYRRSRNQDDTGAFGTQKDVYEHGYEYLGHSMWPKKMREDKMRFTIGKNSCRQPYSASRLNISAMSYGALSSNAVLALNLGAKHGGFYHNTGEGAISDWHLEHGGDIVWNIGTGYFGCRTNDGLFDPELFAERAALPAVKMIEVKLSQGAKPAHGGMLPAGKITEEISRIRNVPMGEDVHSPPTHSAFKTPAELMEFMAKLREISGKPVGFKFCMGCQTEMMALVRAAHETGLPPDFITLDGGEGGTGAAPKEFSNNVGAPLRNALGILHDSLVGAGIRHKIAVIVSGKIVTGFDMARAFALGADVCNSARAFLFSLGCIQALQCNSNKCPTGITTQDERLVKGLVVEEKWKRVYAYHKNTVKNMTEVVGAAGVDDPKLFPREKIIRKVNLSDSTRKNFLELYPRLVPGCLLEGTAPTRYQDLWDDAGLLLEQLEGRQPARAGKIGPPYILEVLPYENYAYVPFDQGSPRDP